MNGGHNAAPGRVRIIGGSLRNSRLNVPDLAGLRPTAERVRETLFNWLTPVIDGARCLDLCAGTGALGIEALSRGAASVQFVEREARAAQALRDNLARLKADAGQVATLDAGVLRGLEAVHLAAARVFGDELSAVVTYDARMARSASLLGLRVAAPR